MAITYIDEPSSKIEYLDQPQKPKIGAMDAFSLASDYLPQNIVRRHTLDPLGEGLTEALGRRGFPITGAAAGTAVQIAPEILSSYLGLKGIYNSNNPVVKGLTNTPQELGPQFEAQNTAIGVTRRVPAEGGMAPRYAPFERVAATKQPIPSTPAEQLPSNIPVRYPSKPGDFLAYANARLSNAPKGVAPQELMDWQVKLQTDISNGTIPKIDPTTGRPTTIYQQAVDLLGRTKGYFNKIAEPALSGANLPEDVIPTRSGLNQAFKISANQQSLVNALKKAGKYGVIAALGYGGAKTALSKLAAP